MRVLGIETSGVFSELALMAGEGKAWTASSQVPFSHAETLNLLFEGLLRTAKLEVRDLELLAVSIGPGLFTSLRVGLSFAKALAFALGTPVRAVPTLRALAEEFPGIAPLLVATADAKKGELYFAAFRWEENRWIPLHPEGVASPSRLRETFPEALFVGAGPELYPDLAGPPPGCNRRVPSALTVARLGVQFFEEEGASDPVSLEPRYIRPSDAEAKLLRRQKP